MGKCFSKSAKDPKSQSNAENPSGWRDSEGKLINVEAEILVSEGSEYSIVHGHEENIREVIDLNPKVQKTKVKAPSKPPGAILSNPPVEISLNIEKPNNNGNHKPQLLNKSHESLSDSDEIVDKGANPAKNASNSSNSSREIEEPEANPNQISDFKKFGEVEILPAKILVNAEDEMHFEPGLIIDGRQEGNAGNTLSAVEKLKVSETAPPKTQIDFSDIPVRHEEKIAVINNPRSEIPKAVVKSDPPAVNHSGISISESAPSHAVHPKESCHVQASEVNFVNNRFPSFENHIADPPTSHVEAAVLYQPVFNVEPPSIVIAQPEFHMEHHEHF